MPRQRIRPWCTHGVRRARVYVLEDDGGGPQALVKPALGVHVGESAEGPPQDLEHEGLSPAQGPRLVEAVDELPVAQGLAVGRGLGGKARIVGRGKEAVVAQH